MLKQNYRADLGIDQAEFSSFVKSKMREYFGDSLFSKYLSHCKFRAFDSQLVITVSDEKIFCFVSSNLPSISEFCSITWHGCGVVPIVKKSYDSSLLRPEVFLLDEKPIHNVIFSNFNDSTYSFDDFIEDSSNDHALYLARTFSSVDIVGSGALLMISGNVGHGKTHLARSVSRLASENGVDNVYFSAESFSNAFISSLRQRSVFDFKASILSKQLLVMDDVHCLLGRKQTCEEFMNILTNLLDDGKNVVMTSSLPVSAFGQRMQSRMLSGFHGVVEKPTIELKTSIANRMVIQRNISISSDDIIFLVQNICGGIRELKGALNRLAVSSALHGRKITREVICSSLGDLLSHSSGFNSITAGGYSVEKISRAVSVFLEVPENQMFSNSRVRSIVFARGLAMYLCRSILRMTFAQISISFGRSSHQSTIASIGKIASLVKNSRDVANQVESVKRMLAKIL